MRRAATILVLVGAVIAARAGVARADGSSDEGFEPKPKPKIPIDLEIAALIGYGSYDFNLGLGGRVGVSVLGIYGGATVAHYFGGNVGTSGVDLSVSFLTYGGELGYGFKIGFLTIRPLVGFGEAVESFPANENPGMPVSTFYVQPGGLLELGFGHLIFGVDAAALLPTAPAGDIGPIFTTHGQVGVRFDVPGPPGTRDE